MTWRVYTGRYGVETPALHVSFCFRCKMRELLERLLDETALPEPQQKFWDFISKLGKEWIDQEIIAEKRFFFWILSDGSIVASGSGEGEHHGDGARAAGTSLGRMMGTGALRGTFFGTVGIEVWKGVLVSREQVKSVQYLIDATDENLIIDIFDPETEGIWYYINRRVSNDLLSSILNGNGKVKHFQKTMEEIGEIDRELGESLHTARRVRNAKNESKIPCRYPLEYWYKRV